MRSDELLFEVQATLLRLFQNLPKLSGPPQVPAKGDGGLTPACLLWVLERKGWSISLEGRYSWTLTRPNVAQPLKVSKVAVREETAEMSAVLKKAGLTDPDEFFYLTCLWKSLNDPKWSRQTGPLSQTVT
jgi:hypothetical protein